MAGALSPGGGPPGRGRGQPSQEALGGGQRRCRVAIACVVGLESDRTFLAALIAIL